MKAQLGYFTMAVGDLDRAKAFYGAIFGWEFDETAKPTDRYAHVAGSDVPFGLNDLSGPSARLYFRVDDVENATARVKELGGHIDEYGKSETGGYADCRDDQGNHFSLWQPAPDY
jgi:predicted enzyme related to lactoylglutathione lyase